METSLITSQQHNTSSLHVHWFRQDLRLADNPALSDAAARGSVLPVYILDDGNSGEWAMGGASRWWLHHSLSRLNESLQGRLLVLRGDPRQLLPALTRATGATTVHWNRCYEPWRIARDTHLKELLQEESVGVFSHNGSLLWEPWQILKSDQTPYQMFTPYYRKGCLQAQPPRMPLSAPATLQLADPAQLFLADRASPAGVASRASSAVESAKKPHDLAVAPPLALLASSTPLHGQPGIDALGLLPTIEWDLVMRSTWTIGEHAAMRRLQQFLCAGLQGYREGRNFPPHENVSRLSPHLHFGEVSPHQLWAQARQAGLDQRCEDDLDCFESELGWREFSYYLLYHRPTLPRQNLQSRFDRFPWQNNPDLLSAWQRGSTGYPLVDAGMRELWQTGYMHNRVRMVVGSFLVKNLLTHWHRGEEWFWDTLVDADLASNSASWQWIAGCGADAAPYFRVFNPVTQSEKFDPKGVYIRRHIPELSRLPDKYLHNPSAAPLSELNAAGITLGKTYPRAIVDLRDSREAALAAFKSLQS